MNANPLLILLHLALALIGIFIGTVAVVGHCFAPVSWPYRVAYGAIGLMLLAQPAMFAGAVWVIGIGLAAAVLSIVREVLRGRAQPKLVASG